MNKALESSSSLSSHLHICLSCCGFSQALWPGPQTPALAPSLLCSGRTQGAVLSPLHVDVLSHFSRVRLCATLWTAAHQAPLSMGFFWQEYWSGLPCPPPGDLLNPGIKPTYLSLLHWQARSLPKNHLGSCKLLHKKLKYEF